MAIKKKNQYGFGEREVECFIHLDINVECSRCGQKLYNTIGEHDFSNNDIFVEYCRECSLLTLWEIGTKEERFKLFEELKEKFHE